jgi:hypothetical protein
VSLEDGESAHGACGGAADCKWKMGVWLFAKLPTGDDAGHALGTVISDAGCPLARFSTDDSRLLPLEQATSAHVRQAISERKSCGYRGRLTGANIIGWNEV